MIRVRAGVQAAMTFLLCSRVFLVAQELPVSDPHALLLAKQSIAAQTRGQTISDVTLTANVTWVGSDNESGTAILYANGIGESRLDLYLSGGLQSATRSDLAADTPQRVSSFDGTPMPWATDSSWQKPCWFFPSLS